ncbi:MAG: uroporphyrinogen decarboxylase family protein [Planctomycetota bacterium]
MTSRERLLTVLRGEIPDCVPVMPDTSNMIPARLTGKPFWDLYLYNDPPIWEAYIECAKHFGFDSLMDGYFPFQPTPPGPPDPDYDRYIVYRDEDRIVVQGARRDGGRLRWDAHVAVYYRADPPTGHVNPADIGLPPEPERWEPLEGVKPVDCGPEGLKRMKQLMGDQGLVGVWGGANTIVLHNEREIFDYYDDPEKYDCLAEERIARVDAHFAAIMALEVKPDFVCLGGSGSLVFQTPEIVRRIALPAVKHAAALYASVGMPTHVHSCGPETELVRMLAEETELTVVDPLEVPPMGDCDLADLKRRFGDRLVLKGNLHTTDVMLKGTPEDVVRASRQAIDDAAAGGRFILSTGDQCGRDTPDANLRAMVETARTYGRYDRTSGQVLGDRAACTTG